MLWACSNDIDSKSDDIESSYGGLVFEYFTSKREMFHDVSHMSLALHERV